MLHLVIDITEVFLIEWKSLSHVWLFATPGSIQSMEFSRPEYCRGWKWKWSHSVVSDSLWPPWTIACQAPLSLAFSRQEYWSGLPCPSPGDFLDPGIEPGSLILQAHSLPSEPPGWVAVPFSGGASQPRNWTQVSHTAGGFFISWTTREA